MAVFEQRVPSKISLDDTVPLVCHIESSLNVKDHTEYTIRVQRGIVGEHSWTVTKRYSDFSMLDAALKISGYELPLPPKKVFGKMDRDFISERQTGLQNYLLALADIPLLSNNITVKNFLDPDNYSLNLQAIALQHISMFFRSEPKWEVVESLPGLGCRLRKEYFAIKDKQDPKSKYILSWCRFGPDKSLDDKDLSSLMKLTAGFQHPNIYPMKQCFSNETSGISIRPFEEKGTLRDMMRQVNPKDRSLKKYGTVQVPRPLPLQYVRLYGRQILETLKFLHDKGIPYGHLHAGNVIVENNLCRILDLENWFIGVPSCYRHYISEFRKINTLELFDVYCFGQLLYEMATGRGLDASTCDDFSPECPAQLRSVMESILTAEACKNGLPSITDLLSHTLFRDIQVTPYSDKPQVKIPSKLKEALKEAKVRFENRLQAEQKLIHKHRRISKAQAFHMSDVEKRKRRKHKKKQLSLEVNGSGHERTPSPASSQRPAQASAASGDIPPPPGPPPSTLGAPPPPPPPPPVPPQQRATDPSMTSAHGSSKVKGRNELLGSICQFNKNALKKAETTDKSSPSI